MEKPIVNISDVMSMTESDMQKVNQHLKLQLNSEVILINQIAAYIINNGGKRLRPVLMVLISKALNYQGVQHINLAAVIELIHTATLLHDDVVDESEMRRGEKTSHEIWGNSASVLVGDFLYSKSFQMMIQANSMQVMSILSDATNKISEGEVQQLLNIGNLAITEQDYFQIIANKTAKLFEAACELAGVIANKDKAAIEQLGQFGMNLGTAFQIADDVLDYTADDQSLGKNLGDDFREGKLTLPLIYLLKNGSSFEQKMVQQAIENPEKTDFSSIRTMVVQSDAIKYTLKQAQVLSDKAIKALKDMDNSPAKEALCFLCDYAWKRSV
ncbi:polyprenyl synthetase family protein [Marinicella litoralis]|uniref:Octaprenyl diphosphate synthase n=1 Tax=Marinicella litoralis TaxID=644220 RepID=A0A4R6XGA5_9GAMM|nr:polyprenyl synthetase family protein [Marinicella litoralis]TDR18412.1 octaprenyl-diphosphate synthase [Marinicella litoralis]